MFIFEALPKFQTLSIFMDVGRATFTMFIDVVKISLESYVGLELGVILCLKMRNFFKKQFKFS